MPVVVRVRLVFTLWIDSSPSGAPSWMMPWREDITATVPEWMSQRAMNAIDYTTDEEDRDVKGRITSRRLPTRKVVHMFHRPNSPQ